LNQPTWTILYRLAYRPLPANKRAVVTITESHNALKTQTGLHNQLYNTCRLESRTNMFMSIITLH